MNRFVKQLGHCIRLLTFAIIVSIGTAQAASDVKKNGFTLHNSQIPSDEIHRGGPPKDGIPAIDTPGFITANMATHLTSDSRVLGITHKGISKAYPINIMNWHEIVNDRFASEAVTVSFCPLCGSGVAYSTPSGTSGFGVSGLLYNSDVLLYDRDTESLWSQILSRAVSGPRAGERLTRLPLSHTSWGKWYKQHPQTLVLSQDTGFSREYHRDPYARYADSSGVYFPVKQRDPRYHPKERVIGIQLDGHTRAYPFSELARTDGNISDRIGTHTITVRYNDADQSGIILNEQGNELATITAFWFAWYAFHPETEVFKP